MSDGVTRLEFSADDSQLLISLRDGRLLVWDTRPESERDKDRDAIFAAREPCNELLEKVFASEIRNDKFEEAIEEDSSLSDLLKWVALRQLRDMRAKYSNETKIWDELVSQSLSRHEATEKELRQAIRLNFEPGHDICALGYLQYRCLDYIGCIELLNRREAIDPENRSLPPGKRRHMADWAFLAMAHFRLGHMEEAQKCLDSFHEMYAAGDDHHKLRYQALATEADSLLKSASNKLTPAATAPPK